MAPPYPPSDFSSHAFQTLSRGPRAGQVLLTKRFGPFLALPSTPYPVATFANECCSNQGAKFQIGSLLVDEGCRDFSLKRRKGGRDLCRFGGIYEYSGNAPPPLDNRRLKRGQPNGEGKKAANGIGDPMKILRRSLNARGVVRGYALGIVKPGIFSSFLLPAWEDARGG